MERCSDRLGNGVAVYAGRGNNGGDGWVVAESLVKAGIITEVIETTAPRSHEGTKARDAALAAGVNVGKGNDGENLIVDALLGTGTSGAPRGQIKDAIGRIDRRRNEGAFVVSLDVPSGLDATTGQHEGAVTADLTVSFGTMKRGHLISRGICGDIVVVDIGLVNDSASSSLPLLVDSEWVADRVPPIPPDAHKGSRKRLAVVGGGPGMAGATILCGEGALRSGIGLVRIVAAPINAVAIHAAIPAALFQQWPATPPELEKLASSSDVVAIGPGLGNSPMTRDLVERILLACSGPVVIDADALNVFAGDVDSLATLLAGRPSIITPHPAEMSRLLGVRIDEVLANRFEVGSELAKRLGGAVLLKGTPTVVFSSSGARYVSAAGTAALATGGSGDVLTGIASTLLVQMTSNGNDAAEAAACAAFIHGRAAELCKFVRGTTLDDILAALPAAWNEHTQACRPGI
ncbi:MAG TPA: NAD(P)H-hydrate dehydratase, partial [Gemmatimonadaceae bacterium]|nr:NAD(P)H-hydrate dehydratase [Gemmatimonadaceae bacterium]